MSAELFLEIGTEEIPAGFLPTAMADLERLVRKELDDARIGFTEVRTFATPRRLVLAVCAVARHQERREISALGPSVKVAFDADGNPTKAAQGFARSNGIEVADLQRRQTDKGEYLYFSKVEEGRDTAALLPEMLPRIIAAIPFRKSMRWQDLEVRFARPMHWIVALFDGAVVPFSFGNLTSGNLSRGIASWPRSPLRWRTWPSTWKPPKRAMWWPIPPGAGPGSPRWPPRPRYRPAAGSTTTRPCWMK
jgi:glycyl-tRNA synthetase beta chain